MEDRQEILNILHSLSHTPEYQNFRRVTRNGFFPDKAESMPQDIEQACRNLHDLAGERMLSSSYLAEIGFSSQSYGLIYKKNILKTAEEEFNSIIDQGSLAHTYHEFLGTPVDIEEMLSLSPRQDFLYDALQKADGCT